MSLATEPELHMPEGQLCRESERTTSTSTRIGCSRQAVQCMCVWSLNACKAVWVSLGWAGKKVLKREQCGRGGGLVF